MHVPLAGGMPFASKQPRVTEKVVHSTIPVPASQVQRPTHGSLAKADADADLRRSHFGQDCCQLPTALPSSAFVRRRLVRGWPPAVCLYSLVQCPWRQPKDEGGPQDMPTQRQRVRAGQMRDLVVVEANRRLVAERLRSAATTPVCGGSARGFWGSCSGVFCKSGLYLSHVPSGPS